jgi:hypothetical protein
MCILHVRFWMNIPEEYFSWYLFECFYLHICLLSWLQADKICLDSMDVQTLRKKICQEVLCFPSLRGYYQAFNTKFLWASNFHLKLVDIGIKRFLELCLESCLMFRTSHACTCKVKNHMYVIVKSWRFFHVQTPLCLHI